MNYDLHSVTLIYTDMITIYVQVLVLAIAFYHDFLHNEFIWEVLSEQ